MRHDGKINSKSAGEKASEKLSVAIITGSLLLCVGVSALGFFQNQGFLASGVQTAAQIDTHMFENYTQLSDPLLVLVNEEVSLPEEFQVTPRMVDDEVVDIRAYDALMAMFKAAEKEEVWFWVASGYRSVHDQKEVLDRAVQENKDAGLTSEEALKKALRTIAKPGHSEHHTGLVVDLNDVSKDFEETAAYRWLSLNGAEYGFVQRYRGDKASITGIDNESWHYRYVGKKHAKEMQRLDMCLEEYVLYLKSQGEK